MQPRWIVVISAALAAAGAGLDPLISLGETAPPWKPFAVCAVADMDGKSVPAIITPGPMPDSWVAIIGGMNVWQMTRLSAPPTPNPPSPPNPPAPPPNPPTPAHEAKLLALSAAEKLPADRRREDAQKLAAVYRALADQIPGPIDSIEKLITANRYAREIALGPRRSKVWDSWVKEIGAWLDAQRAAGSLRTIEDCKPVWQAIAEGLEAVK